MPIIPEPKTLHGHLFSYCGACNHEHARHTEGPVVPVSHTGTPVEWTITYRNGISVSGFLERMSVIYLREALGSHPFKPNPTHHHHQLPQHGFARNKEILIQTAGNRVHHAHFPPSIPSGVTHESVPAMLCSSGTRLIPKRRSENNEPISWLAWMLAWFLDYSRRITSPTLCSHSSVDYTGCLRS